ncbi:MAG: glutaredoxin family protein [Vicinamibacterales bacterium]|jgi:glutaredoxin|nr:glutaredoxin family protein [Vicinamibacterales bacterium]
MDTVTLYTRPGCCLCDEMKQELLRRGHPLVEVNIDEDEALQRRYWLEIPVAVLPDGTVLARHRLEARNTRPPQRHSPGADD